MKDLFKETDKYRLNIGIKHYCITAGCLVIFLFSIQCKSGDFINQKEEYDYIEEIYELEYIYSLHQGIKYSLLGDYKSAIYYFKRCLEIYPDSDVAFYELSKIYSLGGEIDLAVESAARALDLDTTNIWYYVKLAKLYSEDNNQEKTIELYQKAIEVFYDNVDLYVTLGSIYENKKMYDKALDIYAQIEKMTGINESVSIARNHIFIKRGEYEKAHRELKKLVDEFPHESAYYGMLAEFYISVGMNSEALDSYEKLFKIDPDNGIAQISIAEFFIKDGKFDRAVEYLIKAIRNPKLGFEEKVKFVASIMQGSYMLGFPSEKIEEIGELLVEEYPEENFCKVILAEYYIDIGYYYKAVALLDEMHASDPDNILIAEQLAGSLTFNEDYELVKEIGKNMIIRFQESFFIPYFLGTAHYMTNETVKAAKYFEIALKKEGITGELKAHIYTYLIDVYHKLGNFSDSDKSFERLVGMGSNNLVAFNNYAYFLALREEKLEKALKLSKETIIMEPENYHYLDTYAWVLYKLGNYVEALKYIEHAYNHGGHKSYDVLKHYGKILIKTGNHKEAKGYLLKTIEMTDDPAEIEKLLLMIEEDIIN